jgi:YHS domain-containing protein
MKVVNQRPIMKKLKTLIALALTVPLLAAPFTGLAEDKPAEKAKPYTLDTCVVSGDKLGEMGKPYVFTYKGQEIKMCCKSCRKKFDKDPAKYVKKIEEAEAKKKQASGQKG